MALLKTSPRGHERALQKLWGGGRLLAKPLQTAVGPLQVVFPGWANHDSGPDFRGAVIARENSTLVKGDVEVHIHPRDWEAHGHQRDPAYNAVVLQVVWRDDLSFETLTLEGRRVPTAALEGALDLPLEVLLLAGRDPRGDPRPCVRHEHTAGQVAALLDAEGDARFVARSRALAGDAAALGAEQALYENLTEALGYSKNRAPFKELAQRLPFAPLASMTAGKREAAGLALLESLLLDEAGRLVAPWHSFRVRPENAPRVRIRQAAALVRRFAGEGLLEGLRATLLGASQPAKALPEVLGMGGRGREAAVNVVLPFFHGWALERGDAALAERCLAAYRSHPKLASNGIGEEMQGMLLRPEEARMVVNSARRQQGLLGLYKKRCMGLLCQGCALQSPS